ncbi:hypothetical protein [Kineococcus sp. SYSU DK004]|uniref:hypothetical protein n=1 Tax=Kineococcus sp. SYSU DK004 TaxID=3383125 RepID=UPI003D7DEC71
MDAAGVRAGAPGRSPSPAVEAPSAVEWLRRLADVSGPVRALELWTQAALATGCLGMALDASQLQRVAEWLVEHCEDLPVRMAARSCLVRLRVHRVLNPG